MYSSEDGLANDWHLVHLGSRAAGGTGLIFTEATAVTPEGRISPSDAGMWSDDHIEGWARVTRFVRSQGAVIGMQLAHAGRKAGTRRPWDRGLPLLTPENGGWTPVGPSPVAFGPDHNVPRELSLTDIAPVQGAFRDAARRALQAGFNALEIHSAHGYLSHQFLSPISNRRTDRYGGSYDNRVRFLIETAQQVRTVWPESLPLFVRLSCSDWIESGWTIDDSVELARRLKAEGVDVMDCSSGYIAPGVTYPVGPGWQTHFAERIRREAGILTAAVGEITSASQASEIVASGRADLTLLGREMLRDPHFAYHASRELEEKRTVRLATQYDYAV